MTTYSDFFAAPTPEVLHDDVFELSHPRLRDFDDIYPILDFVDQQEGNAHRSVVARQRRKNTPDTPDGSRVVWC